MKTYFNNKYIKFILIAIVTSMISVYIYKDASLYKNINEINHFFVYPLIILIIAILFLLYKKDSLKMVILYWILMLLAVACLFIYNYEKPKYTYEEALKLVKQKGNLNIINDTSKLINTQKNKTNEIYTIYQISGQIGDVVKSFSFDPYTGQIYEIVKR